MNYQEELEWMYALERKGWILGLERVKNALNILGNPEKKYKVIHIAGTNGKGSVSAMTSNVLYLAGHKVGLFTSPHLASFRERMQVNGELITPESVVKLIRLLRENNVDLTFFEFVTVMAFEYFAQEKCDYVVLETGMGGRLDATNVCYPEISAITSIDLDHVDWLGKTIAKIAREKAGIIKGGGKVIVGKNCQGMDVIDSVCVEKNAQLQEADLYTAEIGLHGEFQKQNAGVAYAICKELGASKSAIEEGIRTVSWPGRLQFVSEGVLFDCAHNIAGMTELSKYIASIRDNYNNLIIVFGVQGRKYYEKMISLLPPAGLLVYTQAKVRGGLDPSVLNNVKAAYIVEDPIAAYKHALSLMRSDDLLLVCGSCYLVGNILADINGIEDGWPIQKN